MAMTQPDFDREHRAWAMLQWGSLLPVAPFCEELAAEQFYSKADNERARNALGRWSAQLDAEAAEVDSKSELGAYYELQRRGLIPKDEFFSPFKATAKKRDLTLHPKWGSQINTTTSTQTSYTDDLKHANQSAEASAGEPTQIRGHRGARLSIDRSNGSTQEPSSPLRGGARRDTGAAGRISNSSADDEEEI